MFKNYISERRQVVRTFCSGIGKTAVIYPVTFLSAIATNTIGLGIIFFVNDVFKATPSQIGWLCATWPLCYFAGCILLRPISNRLLPRYNILIGLTLTFLSVTGIIISPSLVWIFVLYGFMGLSTTFLWPQIMGWLFLRIEGDILNREMGRFNICWSLGVIIGPMLAGYLSEIDSILPIRFACALFLALVFMMTGAIMTLSRLSHDDPIHMEEKRVAATGNADGSFLRFPAWLGLFTSYFIAGVIIAIFPISVQKDLHITKGIIGVLLFIRAFTNTMGFYVMARTKFWHFRIGQMTIGILALGFITFLMAGTQSTVIIGFLLAMLGLFTAQSYTNSQFHSISGSTKRSSLMAIHESVIAIGMIFGSSIGGMIYQRWNMPVLYLCCAALACATAATQFIMTVRHNRRCNYSGAK